MLIRVARLFFSFNGRVGRSAFALATLGMLIFLVFAAPASGVGWLGIATACTVIYCALVLVSKRLHDLDLGAYWLWIAIAPVLVLGAIAYYGALQAQPSEPPLIVRALLILRGLWVSGFGYLVGSLWFVAGLYLLLGKGVPRENRFGPQP